MTSPAPAAEMAQAVRRVYVDTLVRGSALITPALTENLLRRRTADTQRNNRGLNDALASLQQHGATWQMSLIRRLRNAQKASHPDTSGPKPLRMSEVTLVSDDTIQREIDVGRLANSLSQDAQWQFTDLRTRMQSLEGGRELGAHDLLRAQEVSSLWVAAWAEAELSQACWQMLHEALETEFAEWLGHGYHEANRWLQERGVLKEVDLRPFIRRSTQAMAPSSVGVSFLSSRNSQAYEEVTSTPRVEAPRPPPPRPPAPAVSAAALRPADVLAQLQQVLRQQVPALAAARLADVPVREAPMRAEHLAQASPRLQAVIERAQQAMQRPVHAEAGAVTVTGNSAHALDEVRARTQAFKQVLKQAAATPEERATIEIVAMMFQSILQEERLPASVRVWFARLQMPVLRVAVVEPDFFATSDHPARKLIDRMGGCVLGFDAAAEAIGEVLEREIKRVVQVVEAYPDTGSRVFKTVLNEFESFLSNFFAKDNPASREGVSLAQQVEQRETLAIQFTIELRKMLADVPVDDALREFLFQVWADVLAVTAMRHGAQAELTRTMKRAAADLIWSAGAKGSPEERAEVIRRLPPLLKTLRDGMGHAGLAQKRQDEHIRRLNNVLAAAFTAKAAPISPERLEALKHQLQTLEAMLPSLADVDLDEDLVRDLSGHERDGLEVVTDGGAEPTPAVMAWARELAVGSWFKLKLRGREDVVQLAWVGSRHQLLLFVSGQGRAVLFQLHRLASFLQASLIQPAQEESLTVKATRDALAKLEDDPAALTRAH